MIIWRDRPLKNDHPSPWSNKSPLPGCTFNLSDLSRTICSYSCFSRIKSLYNAPAGARVFCWMTMTKRRMRISPSITRTPLLCGICWKRNAEKIYLGIIAVDLRLSFDVVLMSPLAQVFSSHRCPVQRFQPLFDSLWPIWKAIIMILKQTATIHPWMIHRGGEGVYPL